MTIEEVIALLSLCFTCFGLGYKAVSYTHLDVYKRQVQWIAGLKTRMFAYF